MVKVSIPSPGNGAAAPVIKDPTVIIISVADIATEPSRTHGNTSIDGNITLSTGAKGIGVYATPSSIEITEEVQGEADARGILQGVAFNHPGDSVAIANLAESVLNEGVVILVKACEGGYRLVGSKCNPLYNQPEYLNSSEGTRRRFVFKQEQAGKYVVAHYSGTVPDLAAAAAGESA